MLCLVLIVDNEHIQRELISHTLGNNSKYKQIFSFINYHQQKPHSPYEDADLMCVE